MSDRGTTKWAARTHGFRSPLVCDGQAMSMGDFQRLPRCVGYTYEYTEGRARITPNPSSLLVVAVLLDQAGQGTSSGGVRPSCPDGVSLVSVGSVPPQRIVAHWVRAFDRAPEYYGYTTAALKRDAAKQVDAWRSEQSHIADDASSVAVIGSRPVGVLLVSARYAQPSLAIAFVDPTFRRRGIGRFMVHHASEALRAHQVRAVTSTYHLANQHSAAWHHALGFRELPDWLVARHRARCASHNARLGLVDDVYEARRQAERLRAEADALQMASERDDVCGTATDWLHAETSRIEASLA